MHIFSVRTLTQAIKDVLESEFTFVWMRWQISKPPSGHMREPNTNRGLDFRELCKKPWIDRIISVCENFDAEEKKAERRKELIIELEKAEKIFTLAKKLEKALSTPPSLNLVALNKAQHDAYF